MPGPLPETPYQRIKRLFNAACDLPDEATQRARLAELGASPDEIERVIGMLAPERTTIFGAPVAGMLASASGSELKAGDRLGPWRLGAELGAGGMGRVFAADRDDGLYQQRAAIKVLLGWAGVEGLARLARERQILASMAHPNIARLLDGGTTPLGRPYLVMEFVDGLPIDAWCRQQTRGVDAVLDLMLMVCDAVAAAHRQLVVHCDLKPSNVMVTADGRAMLLDFGIAQLQGPDSAAAGGAESESLALTPRYASPEQKAGLPATVASDIFGLGRLLDDLLQLATAAPGAAPRPPPRAVEWQAIIDRATAEAPDARYATVQALADELQRFRRHEALQAMPPRPPYVVGKWLRRHWPWALAGSLAAAGALAFTLRLVIERDRARAAEQRALLEAATTRQVSDFVVELFKGADPRQAGRPDLPANVLIERGRDRVTGDLQGQPALQASLMVVLAEAFENIGRADDAIGLYRKAIVLEASREVARPLRAAAAQSRLAVALANSFRDGEAEAPARESLATRLALLGPDAPETADSHSSLGVVLTRSSRLDEARSHLERALALRIRHQGADSVDAATTLHNLGLLEVRAERPVEAEAHYRRALEIKRQKLPPRHLSTLNTLGSLATALRDQQRLGEAEPLMLEALAARRVLHGERSGQVATLLNEYASALHDAGRLGEAIRRFDEALAADPSEADSLSMAVKLNNLAGAQEDAGLLAEAEQGYRRSLAIRLARLGDGDVSVARARHNLGRMLMRLPGRVGEARPLLERAYAVRREKLPGNHGEIVVSQLILAELMLRQRQVPAAADLLAEAAEQERRSPPARRAVFFRIRAMLAQARGEAAEAMQHWQAAHDLASRLLPPGHPTRVTATLDLAEALAQAGQPERARPLLAALREPLAGHGSRSPSAQRATRLEARLR